MLANLRLHLHKQQDTDVFHTVITGADLATVVVTPPQNPADGYAVAFTLKPEAKDTFGAFTKANVGKMLAIVLDKKIVSTPVIHQAIESGEGSISGQGENAYTFDEANNLRITLFYGTLPVALEIAESRVVGPTLGQSFSSKKPFRCSNRFCDRFSFYAYLLSRTRLCGNSLNFLFWFDHIRTYICLFRSHSHCQVLLVSCLSVGSALDANILQFERI